MLMYHYVTKNIEYVGYNINIINKNSFPASLKQAGLTQKQLNNH